MFYPVATRVDKWALCGVVHKGTHTHFIIYLNPVGDAQMRTTPEQTLRALGGGAASKLRPFFGNAM